LQGTQHPGLTFTGTNDRLGLQKTIERWQRLRSINKPTIAQVHGYCLAAGPEFVGIADIVFAYEDAEFGHSFRPRAQDPADDVDVAGADGSAQNQGVFLHWRRICRRKKSGTW
jgi:Enoyl-CoA hydratase/isomerase